MFDSQVWRRNFFWKSCFSSVDFNLVFCVRIWVHSRSCDCNQWMSSITSFFCLINSFDKRFIYWNWFYLKSRALKAHTFWFKAQFQPKKSKTYKAEKIRIWKNSDWFKSYFIFRCFKWKFPPWIFNPFFCQRLKSQL